MQGRRSRVRRGSISSRPLQIVQVPQPEPQAGHVVIKVRACGVCRTDLHIVEGELPPRRRPLIPGHQIVGEIVGGSTPAYPLGARVGVSWIGGTDGTCRYCLQGSENLATRPPSPATTSMVATRNSLKRVPIL